MAVPSRSSTEIRNGADLRMRFVAAVNSGPCYLLFSAIGVPLTSKLQVPCYYSIAYVVVPRLGFVDN